MIVFKTVALRILASFILMVSPIYVFSQKAFEYEYYIGKTKDMTIKLLLADGYIAASEIRTVAFRSKKASRFLTETGYEQADRKMKFYHYSPSQKEFPDYFILENIRDAYELVPREMHGKYYFKNEVIGFTLKISRIHY